MIRRPPRSTLDRSSAASDVYKRQARKMPMAEPARERTEVLVIGSGAGGAVTAFELAAVSYTHLRAHETVLDLVCRLLLAKNTQQTR